MGINPDLVFSFWVIIWSFALWYGTMWQVDFSLGEWFISIATSIKTTETIASRCPVITLTQLQSIEGTGSDYVITMSYVQDKDMDWLRDLIKVFYLYYGRWQSPYESSPNYKLELSCNWVKGEVCDNHIISLGLICSVMYKQWHFLKDTFPTLFYYGINNSNSVMIGPM